MKAPVKRTPVHSVKRTSRRRKINAAAKRLKPHPASKSKSLGRKVKRGARQRNDEAYHRGYLAGAAAPAEGKEPPPAKEVDVAAIQLDARNHGFRDGVYEGGEALIEQQLPPWNIMPGIAIRQVIASGLSQLQEHFIPVLNTEQVFNQLISAINERRPYSLVRIGDGELLTLAHDCVLSMDQVKQDGRFLNYAGVELPDWGTREQLAEAIRRADLVGVPFSRLPSFQQLLQPTFQAHNINLRAIALTSSTINYELYQQGLLAKLLEGKRVLPVGKIAHSFGQILAEKGVAIVDPVSQVNGVRDIPAALTEISRREFDIALVAAGIPAVIISSEVAKQFGKVAVDFGHLADALVRGETWW